jgi:hypothetical protein
MKVTNITKGPKGLNALSGPVEVQAGETVDVEMNDAEVASSTRTGWFQFGSKAKAHDEPVVETDIDKMTVAELKAFLADKKVEIKGDEKKDDLITLAKAA